MHFKTSSLNDNDVVCNKCLNVLKSRFIVKSLEVKHTLLECKKNVYVEGKVTRFNCYVIKYV